MSNASESQTTEHNAEVRRHLRRNYLAHAIDGGFFGGALAFVNAQTVLPTAIKSLGGPNWLVSLAPVLALAGMAVPPIFTAHLIDRLSRYKPLLMATGVFQRMPYLAAAIALFAAAEGDTTTALAVVALAPLVSGLACGATATGWQNLVVRTVPENRRSSVMALRYGLSCVIGLGAGWVVKAVLAARPGAAGYGLLHLMAFGSLAMSYLAFSLIRETGLRPPAAARPHGLRENLQAIPRLVKSAGNLRLYLAAGAMASGIYILIPFLAIYARGVLGRPESYVGDLLVVQMAGAIAGNFAAAYLGDRFGGRLVILVSQATFIALAAWSLVAASDGSLRAIFFLFGFAFFALQVGTMTMTLEICPAARRATHLAIIALVNLPSMLAATTVGGLVWTGPERFPHVAGLAIACVTVSLVLMARVREPRSSAMSSGQPRGRTV